jgi:mRNA-degrading endonuclease toxin of MazEF toxin-antitoxin module
MNSEQQQAIASLRALNLSPKQIARKLGLKPALVTAVIKQQAEQAANERAAAGELEPVVECLVNADCVRTLLPNINGRSSNLVPSNAPNQAEESFTGLALVAVTRLSAYNRLTVCTYLVDPWCLGIKDAIGPRKLEQVEYKQFIEYAYQGFSAPAEKITLEQAQAIVGSPKEDRMS